MISRRNFLSGLGAFVGGSVGLAGYAFGIEPLYRLVVTLRMAVIADLHACEPWVGPDRIRQMVDITNALGADIILLLGDYVVGHRWVMGRVSSDIWAPLLGQLRAPLGVHAVLGNHDWWDDRTAQARGHGPVMAGRALEQAGISVYDNDVVRLAKHGQAFWIAGLGDQLALGRGLQGPESAESMSNLPGAARLLVGSRKFAGVDDLPGTLAKVTDNAPVILMAHEPDVFPRVPDRVALTLSGHTHGGQVRVLGYSPVVPSSFGNRYAYGHVIEEGRHLIVSGGLGCSIAPVRFGVPPEIVVVELGSRGIG